MLVAFGQKGKNGVRRPSRASFGGVGQAAPGNPGHRAPIALVLATALLLCHGVFGASHVLAHGDPARASASAANEHPHGHTAADVAPDQHQVAGAVAGASAGVEGGGGAHEGTTAEYFAVLQALVGAVLIAAYFFAARAPLPARARPVGIHIGEPGPWPLPRGTSPPLLQVFRL
jgi:hypothetical protein